MESNNQSSYMLPCPNCKKLSLPCTNDDGLLTDWCDACDKSIFERTAEDCWDGDESDKVPC
jgi:hypothetical protein